MNLKHFLKPDWKKILITIILFIFIGFYSVQGACLYTPDGVQMGCDRIMGFPLPFNLITDYVAPINIPILVIDLIFWYIVSCLVLWTFYKIRKK